MATWGQVQISFSEYNPELNTLYYSYSTVTDGYYFRIKKAEDFGLGLEKFDIEYRCGQEEGEAMMEAFINHILAYDCSGDVERFVSRYIENNRFRKEQNKYE